MKTDLPTFGKKLRKVMKKGRNISNQSLGTLGEGKKNHLVGWKKVCTLMTKVGLGV